MHAVKRGYITGIFSQFISLCSRFLLFSDTAAMEAAGGSGVRGRRRRPEREEKGEERGERKRRRCEGEGVGSWVCQETYCGLTMQDQDSLARYFTLHIVPCTLTHNHTFKRAGTTGATVTKSWRNWRSCG